MSEMVIKFATYDELLPLKKMKASPHQRNKHPKDQIERLALIMKTHGVRHPIHISKRSGTICFGHGRREAALLNGWKEYPVIYQDFDTDEEEYACVQSDNGIAFWSELDFAQINIDIQNLGPDFDIDLLGIKNFSIEVADKGVVEGEDELPEHVEPKTKMGDLYQLGTHRLLCGDSIRLTMSKS